MARRRVRHAARVFAALAVALCLGACGGSADLDRVPAATPDVDKSALMAIPGRLLVLGTDGSVFTTAPDGSDRVDLAPAGPGRAAAQPAWSPDGTRVAWVDILLRNGVPIGRVATSRADGSERSLVETGAPPFFLAWDPTSARVAYLHADPQSGIALGVVDVATGGGPEVLTRGQPLYFDWSPDGQRLFTHIGDRYLGYVTLTGDAAPLAEPAAVFRAPEWRRDDGRLLYAARLPDGDTLVERDASDSRRAHAQFDGLIAFATSPNGERLAYHVTELEAEAEDDDEPTNIALAQSAPGTPEALDGALVVVDSHTGDTTVVAEEPVATFYWSPRGDRLLYLVVEETIRGTMTRWWVWDEAGAESLEAFAPSLEYARDYLPFFDQFARVSTPWSPDGAYFAYAGIAEDGEAGVWVQSADGAIPPILVADGVYVAWGPD